MHEDDGMSGGAPLKQSRRMRRPTCATQGSDEYIYNAWSGASRTTVFKPVELTERSKSAGADTTRVRTLRRRVRASLLR